MAKSEEKLKSLLLKVKEESEKVASGPMTSWEIDGETVETVSDFIFWAPKSLQMVTAAMKLKTLTLWKEIYDQPREYIQKQRYYFANKVPSSQLWFFQWSCVDVRVGL